MLYKVSFAVALPYRSSSVAQPVHLRFRRNAKAPPMFTADLVFPEFTPLQSNLHRGLATSSTAS